jgi:hypothetical protein
MSVDDSKANYAVDAYVWGKQMDFLDLWHYAISSSKY